MLGLRKNIFPWLIIIIQLLVYFYSIFLINEIRHYYGEVKIVAPYVHAEVKADEATLEVIGVLRDLMLDSKQTITRINEKLLLPALEERQMDIA